jgi:gamma-glutamyltranspeptidase / glutathione hydrolase
MLRLPSAESSQSPGIVTGEPKAAEIGNQVLKDGGNAIDAVVAAALVACVHSPNQCGIGGYGGHMILRLANGSVNCIDFNSAAPAAAHAKMFAEMPREANTYGWLASGVPGTLAGLQLALDRFGSRSFKSVVAPAVELAESGFMISRGLANAIRSRTTQLQNDAASARLYFADGKPLAEGQTLRNRDLGRLLTRVAKRNSAREFYEGEPARQIAGAFARNGGIVTAKDLASYRARLVPTIQREWKGFMLSTPPLTSGGFTILQAFGILQEIASELLQKHHDHAVLEAVRLGWKDRLEKLGDPEALAKSFDELQAAEHRKACAARVKAAIESGTPVSQSTASEPHGGTMHLNAADAAGNVVALTLTHGNAFGACVTVDGLGLTLGHGMSRFSTDPQHPNSPGPGKRPLHNMCPTLVLRNGKPVLAVGAAGGRFIVNTVFHVLWNFTNGKSLQEAIRAPRWHTEGNLDLAVENAWPEAGRMRFTELGYTLRTGGAAVARAIGMTESGHWETAAR